jgi:hypothetical protein
MKELTKEQETHHTDYVISVIASALVTASEGDEMNWKEAARILLDALHKAQSERDTYKRSHEAMDWLSETMQDASSIKLTHWSVPPYCGFNVCIDGGMSDDDYKFESAPTLIEAIESAR